MTLSRRQFLESLGIGRAKASQDTPPKEAQSKWIEIGPLSNFPPGESRVCAGQGVTVRSHPEGLQVLDAGILRPARIEVTGRISYHPSGEWPFGSALSVMTGERIELSNTKGHHNE